MIKHTPQIFTYSYAKILNIFIFFPNLLKKIHFRKDIDPIQLCILILGSITVWTAFFSAGGELDRRAALREIENSEKKVEKMRASLLPLHQEKQKLTKEKIDLSVQKTTLERTVKNLEEEKNNLTIGLEIHREKLSELKKLNFSLENKLAALDENIEISASVFSTGIRVLAYITIRSSLTTYVTNNYYAETIVTMDEWINRNNNSGQVDRESLWYNTGPQTDPHGILTLLRDQQNQLGLVGNQKGSGSLPSNFFARPTLIPEYTKRIKTIVNKINYKKDKKTMKDIINNEVKRHKNYWMNKSKRDNVPFLDELDTFLYKVFKDVDLSVPLHAPYWRRGWENQKSLLRKITTNTLRAYNAVDQVLKD